MAHAALVFDGDVAVGWCEYGTPEELPSIYHRAQYEKEQDLVPDYRLTCFFIDRDHRRQGVSAAALRGRWTSSRRPGAAWWRGLPAGYPGQEDLGVVPLQRHPRPVREGEVVSAIERCAAIIHVSADAAPWVAAVVTERCPNTVQCADPFHVVRWATQALDEVRRSAWNEARGAVRQRCGRTSTTSPTSRPRSWPGSPRPTHGSTWAMLALGGYWPPLPGRTATA